MRRALIASAILACVTSGTPARAAGAAAALKAKNCKCSWSQHNNDPNSGLWICTVPPGCGTAKRPHRRRHSPDSR